MVMCTPGMGVNLWGESPLYMNPVNVFNTLTKVLADGKGVSVRKGLKGWSEAQGEPKARGTKGSGNPECKTMSRRTETAYKVQFPGELAQHNEAQELGDLPASGRSGSRQRRPRMLRLCSKSSRSYPGRSA